ncbi:competence protein ComGF [Streptococcus uberis]|nr:competence protein ComGF [Streptococcus uberis]
MIKAFTLLEAMIALLVVSGSLLVYQGLTKSTFANINFLRQNNQDSWLLFAHQFRAELERAQFVDISGNKLMIQKDQKKVSFRVTEKHDFRKSAANGKGYNPMLFHVRKAEMFCQDKELTIHFLWENGMERDFVYVFAK